MMYCPKHGNYDPRSTDGACPECQSESEQQPFQITYNPSPPVGWICPVCGAGRSPFVDHCPCKPCTPPTETTSSLSVVFS